MKIHIKGSQDTIHTFSSALGEETELVPYSDAELCVVEIDSIETLYKAPKKFSVKTFFYISTKDPKVIDGIKNFKIAGVFTPPLKPEAITRKMALSSNGTAAAQAGEGDKFDVIKAKIIAKAENIPSLPAVANELLKLTRKEDSQMKEYVDKIKQDQGISSKVIKLVNSPFYGLRKDVNSIDRATVLLGVNTVKNLALAVSTEGYYNKQFNLYKTTGQQMWEHSFKTATLAEIIGRHIDQDGDALYLAGLMHDLGKTVLVDFLVKEVDSPEDEISLLGMDHSQVSELILNKWSVTSEITSAVKKHHSLTGDPFNDALYYANRLSKKDADCEENISEMASHFKLNMEDIAHHIHKALNHGEEDE